jgi:histidine triad (HIT) family protein
MDTIFTKISTHSLPAYIIYETEEVIAFLDIHPSTYGHSLFIPKEWSRNALSISKESWKSLMESVHFCAPKIYTALSADGMNIATNCEEMAGQIIFHTHIHILPRFKEKEKNTLYKNMKEEDFVSLQKTLSSALS